MFVRLFADNYRCLSNFTLEFGEFSVLLGPNGVGKTTVLEVFEKLRNFLTGKGKSLTNFPPETLTVWDERDIQTFECDLKEPVGLFRYRLRLSHQRKTALNKVIEESLSLDGKPLFQADEETVQLYSDSHQKGPILQPDWHVSGISRIYPRHDNQKLMAFRNAVENTLILSPNPGKVNAVTEGRTSITTPGRDCSDFAGWLVNIISSRALLRQRLESALAEGGLQGFRAFEAPESGDAFRVYCRFENPGKKSPRVRLDELSSGQIALIILETAFGFATDEDTPGPITLMLDEPGNYLALPEVQPLLARIRDGAMENRFQAILTAHHPMAIDFLAGSFGVWLDRDPSGPTRVYPVKVSPDMANADGGLRISDLVARGWLSSLGIAQPGEGSVHGPN